MNGIGLFSTSLVLLSLVFTVSTLSPVSRQFDISEYVYGVDHDLQARARAAVEAESFKFRRNSWPQRAKQEPCQARQERPCPPSKYRTPSGACNNVRHPAWGARGSPYLRILPPAYVDGKLLRNISSLSSLFYKSKCFSYDNLFFDLYSYECAYYIFLLEGLRAMQFYTLRNSSDHL
ncbi:PREDICTED: uncharacterized protein LOC105362703 [Ceratosolen solmsi marchali]|uniref:Uncharacterized protein LOC105362703 n=1 Tax=Ceratosolen solmsi marchali TaxID=326594 RepID=A0AAJ6YI48_9HYME|nr:PREDICTED: uncharacterized protein LOC105362703 [Ceratosolen solmsi marchali]